MVPVHHADPERLLFPEFLLGPACHGFLVRPLLLELRYDPGTLLLPACPSVLVFLGGPEDHVYLGLRLLPADLFAPVYLSILAVL